MARRRRSRAAFGRSKCSGQYFKLKTKRGTQCVCAAYTPSGDFRVQFAKNAACPARGTAMTYAQARKRFAK